ncbi:MAG: hypothetical protein AUH69_00385 [Actinobacteria bacterium 13_1_40CM_4_65_12]|nr:MAG: hypothetical protein AUH69_00385 [Actinobacteria bacterium 13_1_40CM_4_65_12]
MQTDNRKTRRAPWVWRIIRARPRLFASFMVSIAATVALAVLTDWRPVMRDLVGWDIGVGLYVILAFEMMARADVHQIRRRAAAQDEGAIVILILTVAAALASILAIVGLLGTSAAGAAPRRSVELILATITIVLSWAFIHTIFALHYAHEFYDESGVRGMAFPGALEKPDYWDFVYFSLVIGMTSQVSDVGITTKEIRRTVAAHGVVSFFFNAALLALTVNIAASAI